MLFSALNGPAARLARLAGLAAIAATVVLSTVAPAVSGRGLVVLIALLVAAGAWLIWTFWTCGLNRATPDLYVIALTGGFLATASPNSAASALAFVAAIATAARTGLRRGLSVALTGSIALAAGAIIYGGVGGAAVLAYTLGFCAFALAGSNRRQAEQRAEQAELLLAQAQRSHEERLRVARLEESTRIARDIHDVLAHSLAGLAIQLEATDALLASGADIESVRNRVQQARDLVREGLGETRRAVGALRGDAPLPLTRRIQQLTEDHRAISGGHVESDLQGDLDSLTPQVGDTVFRTAQEALTNVRKHAPGCDVALAVVADQSRVSVTVEDFTPITATVAPTAVATVAAAGGTGAGEGVAPDAAGLSATGGGFGLIGMRERAQQLGGTLIAGPSALGWRVEVTVPTVEPR